MPRRPEGIPARELDEDTLRRELVHLYETREDTFFAGSAAAYEEHTARMLELESEYARRRPDRTKPAPARTREGARARSAPKGRSR
jgi:hypothetical protein